MRDEVFLLVSLEQDCYAKYWHSNQIPIFHSNSADELVLMSTDIGHHISKCLYLRSIGTKVVARFLSPLNLYLSWLCS